MYKQYKILFDQAYHSHPPICKYSHSTALINSLTLTPVNVQTNSVLDVLYDKIR